MCPWPFLNIFVNLLAVFKHICILAGRFLTFLQHKSEGARGSPARKISNRASARFEILVKKQTNRVPEGPQLAKFKSRASARDLNFGKTRTDMDMRASRVINTHVKKYNV